MTQVEAVVQVMRENGGSATLGWLYQHALMVPGVKWGTKTPFSSINRIVQTSKQFFRIRPGLWALIEYRDRFEVSPRKAEEEELSHAYYQGLIVELGNLQDLKTFVPPQDRGKLFVNKPLGQFVTLSNILPFSYDSTVRKASFVDVVWFNERKMPAAFFEVEHRTAFDNSLLRFLDLQDFSAQFFIVAPAQRERQFHDKISRSVYAPISKRVKFKSYDVLGEMHSKMHALSTVKTLWNQ